MVTRLLTVNNSSVANQEANFEISSQDYIMAEGIAEMEKLSLLGVYHSHPNYPAIPSELDQKAAQPNFSYIIISIIDRKFSSLTSWMLDDEFHFLEEEIAAS